MKRPLLKILPGVAVVLLSTSCSKEDDNAVENDATIVAEQTKEKKVFYLKVRNASSLSKMAIEGLGTPGEKAFKFEEGDELTLKFKIDVQREHLSTNYDATIQAEVIAKYTSDGFEVTTDNIAYYDENGKLEQWNGPDLYYQSQGNFWYRLNLGDVATAALAEMQEEATAAEAAKQYKVELFWGKEEVNSDLVDKTYLEYSSLKEMLADAPRSAKGSFTLQQNGAYSFIIFEEGCTKEVKIGENQLDNSKFYIISAGAENVTVNTSSKTIESGKIYYVRK